MIGLMGHFAVSEKSLSEKLAFFRQYQVPVLQGFQGREAVPSGGLVFVRHPIAVGYAHRYAVLLAVFAALLHGFQKGMMVSLSQVVSRVMLMPSG